MLQISLFSALRGVGKYQNTREKLERLSRVREVFESYNFKCFDVACRLPTGTFDTLYASWTDNDEEDMFEWDENGEVDRERVSPDTYVASSVASLIKSTGPRMPPSVADLFRTA